MIPGAVILAHERVGQAARLARHLAGQGAAVVVHLDRAAGPDAARALAAAAPGVEVLSAHRTCWGGFGLVEATLAGVRRLLDGPRPPGHVCLLSGDTLPLRPLAELGAFLAANPGVEMIEAVPAAQGWARDGLEAERMTLRHPLPWRRWPRAFAALAAAQRALGLRRPMPPGLSPWLGGQWWCLSAGALGAILADPRLPAWRRFFRAAHIPDEAFFQTVLHRDGSRPARVPPPVLSRFDATGRPFVYYDEHAGWLAGADHFFLRKADPDAAGLADACFSARGRGHGRFAGTVDERPFAAARARQCGPGRPATPGHLPQGATALGFPAGCLPAAASRSGGVKPAPPGRNRAAGSCAPDPARR